MAVSRASPDGYRGRDAPLTGGQGCPSHRRIGIQSFLVSIRVLYTLLTWTKNDLTKNVTFSILRSRTLKVRVHHWTMRFTTPPVPRSDSRDFAYAQQQEEIGQDASPTASYSLWILLGYVYPSGAVCRFLHNGNFLIVWIADCSRLRDNTD